MKKISAATLMIGSVLLFSQTSLASFRDVGDNYSYARSINWLQANNVVNGYGDGTFRPDQSVSRAEFLKMLYESLGEGADYVGKPLQPFVDVEGGEWYGNYVTKAYLKGIIDGYPDKTFRPNNPINVAEALKIVVNGFFKDKDLFEAFKDLSSCEFDKVDLLESVDLDAWYFKFLHFSDGICAIPQNMIMNKDGKVIFDPAKNLTRGEMAELLYRTKAVLDNSVVAFDDYVVSDLAIFRNNEIAPKDIIEPNEYVFTLVKAGQMKMGMKVIGIGKVLVDSDVPFGPENLRVAFEGEVTVTGKIYLNEMLGGVSFEPDADSAAKLPRLASKDVMTWFHFTNGDFAESELQLPDPLYVREATVVIDNYVDVNAGAEVANSAKLIEVVKLGENTASTARSSYCTHDPLADESGKTVFPIIYTYGHLPFLGQLFTADSCGKEYLSEVFGVEGDYYTLGVNLITNKAPSTGLFKLLNDMSFQCPQGVALDSCTTWILNDKVKLEEILKLKMYSEEIKQDDCVNCG